MTDLPTLLLVEDDGALRRALAASLSRRFALRMAADVFSAKLALRAGPLDAVLTDFHLPDGTGLDVLREAKMRWPNAVRVLMSASDGAFSAQDSEHLASVAVPKPFNVVIVGHLIARLVAAAHSGKTPISS